MFSLISGRHVGAHLHGHQHTVLCKFAWNILTDNWSTKYRTNPRLGQAEYPVVSTTCNIIVLDLLFCGVIVKTSN